HPGHENRGMAASRNLGVANTTAPYIAFIDGDDVWVPTKLAEQVDLLERMPDVAMVGGAFRYWYSWDPASKEVDQTFLTGGVADRRIDPPEAALTIFPLVGVDTDGGPGMDLLVRRSVFDAVDGFEERFRTLYDEASLLIKIFLRYPIYISSRAWILYRQHENSSDAGISESTYRRVRGVFLDWVKDDVERLGDPRVSAALRRARRRNRYEKLYGFKSRTVHRLRSRTPAKYKDPVKRYVQLARRYGTSRK
nr:glycosyltransferase [Actinomycetes bacterium]